MGTLSLVTAPAVEPVSVDEAVAHLRLDSDATDERAYLSTLISAARETVEARTRRALISQTWDLVLDSWPVRVPLELPRAPLASVTSVTYVATDGTSTTWSSSNYTVRAYAGPRAMPGTITPAYGVVYPSLRSQPNAVTIRYVAGYGAAATAVPAALRHAALLLVAELYARREGSVVGTIISEVPEGISRLLTPYVVHGWDG